MEKLDRISMNVARMNGEPCIRDLRLTVRRVLEALAFAAALVDDKVLPLPQR